MDNDKPQEELQQPEIDEVKHASAMEDIAIMDLLCGKEVKDPEKVKPTSHLRGPEPIIRLPIVQMPAVPNFCSDRCKEMWRMERKYDIPVSNGWIHATNQLGLCCYCRAPRHGNVNEQ